MTMEFDNRVNDLHEMAAIGNLKAVLHYCQSGVNVNAQNAMNGWTALHWASHRGHEPVVRALVMRGASKDIKTNKGETAADLAKKPDIRALFGKTPEEDEKVQASADEKAPPKFVPAYLAQPDLSKLWSMPDGSTDDPKLNQEAFVLSNPTISADATPPKLGQAASVPVSAHAPTASSLTPESYAAKELLVYSGSVSDENLLGAIFANVEDTIERTVQLIQEEIDDVPQQFGLGRFNGSKVVPVNTKQYTRKTGDFFRGEDDAIVLIERK